MMHVVLFKNVRGALGMGLFWAFGGALAALPIESVIDPHGDIVDVWVAVLAYPGLAGGVIFFTLLRIAERGRQFRDMRLSRVAACGAVTGLLLFALASVLFMADAAPPHRALVGIGAIACSTAAACVSVIYGGLVVQAFDENDEWRQFVAKRR